MPNDDTRISHVLVGLPDIRVLDAVDDGVRLTITVEKATGSPSCPTCATTMYLKDRRDVTLVDLPYRGRCARVIWRKRRFRCADRSCSQPTFTEQDRRIALPRHSMLARAARWTALQVGRLGRTVNEVANELGCHWPTVNDAVTRVGRRLLTLDRGRLEGVSALGLDETSFVRRGPFHRREFATSIVDVRRGRLLDMVEGRTAEAPARWLLKRSHLWRSDVEAGTLDLSGPYRRAFEIALPKARLVADPFHVVKHAVHQLDECRRRVQNELLGHRGRKEDPLFRARRLLVKAAERLDDKGTEKLRGLLRAGDPHGHVAAAWHAKEAVRELYALEEHETAAQFIDELIRDMADPTWPIEVRSLGRTLSRWRHEIVAWHDLRVSNGPTEASNNLVKRIKRVGFGFTNFENYRMRALLYAGGVDWSLLDRVIPR